MKKLITNYTFNSSAKTIVFNDYTSLDIRKLLLITNTKTNTIIYNFASTGGTVSGNTLTLSYDTTSMSSSDPLQIFYDDGRIVSDHFENPFGTAEGQVVVSSSESFWARLNRIGRPRSNTANGVLVSANAGTLVTTAGITTSIGCVLYPTVCSVSCTTDAILVITTSSGLQDGQITYAAYTYAKAGTPITVKFDGESYCEENTGIGIGAIPLSANSGGLIYGSTSAIEVEMNY
jgi:hypothetical protein